VIGGTSGSGPAATILPGVTVGAASVVAAGAVVTRDVPPATLVAGVPATAISGLESTEASFTT
jgi:acetyltransferase-like isoleucine patch superfamily enzyme